MAHYALTVSGLSDLDVVHRGLMTTCTVCADVMEVGRVSEVNQNSDTPAWHYVDLSTAGDLADKVASGEVPRDATFGFEEEEGGMWVTWYGLATNTLELGHAAMAGGGGDSDD